MDFEMIVSSINIIYQLELERDSSGANCTTSLGRILKFPMNKNINDGIHSQYSATHRDQGPWV